MRILLTGAAGGIATMIRPQLLAAYGAVRLSDLKAPGGLQPGEAFVAADLADLGQVRRAVEGADAIVHLGGHSVEGPWDTILPSNIVGTYHLFEAAREAGVQRVVFASSNHVMGFYPREQTVDVNRLPRPDSRYGVSKAFGESLGALYADKFGLRVTCLRIGNVGERPIDRRRLSIWLHPEDLVQLVRIGLEHPDIRYEVWYGMSDNLRAWWDNRGAGEFGYRPAHCAEDYAEGVFAREETPDPIGDRFQGGSFCSQEHPGAG